MKGEKAVKINLYISCICLGLTVLMLVAATVAYFSQQKQTVSVLTSGNVEITLSEAAVKATPAGDLIEDTEAPRIFGGAEETVNDYGCVYPGQSIYKDPTIKNVGSEDAWIAAKITVTDGRGDLTRVMGYYGHDGIDIQVLLSGGVFDETVHFGEWNGMDNVIHNDHYAMVQVPNAQEGIFEFYFFFLNPVSTGDSVTLFEHFSVPDDWSNEDLQNLIDLKIKVQAFGVQKLEFESCYDSMTEAFPTLFSF